MRGRGQYVGHVHGLGRQQLRLVGRRGDQVLHGRRREFPTICGTGTEDYFCGSYDFENQETKQYWEFCTPYSGLHQVIRPDGLYSSQQRFGMYRWHIMDPIRFEKDLRVTIQALGWHADGSGRYLPLQDDIASVAYLVSDAAGRAVPETAGEGLPGGDLIRRRAKKSASFQHGGTEDTEKSAEKKSGS